MSVRPAPRSAILRRNRVLGWGLGAVALALYIAIGWRWTRGF